jgi:transposase InsO family protein
MRYAFIERHQTQYPVRKLCAVLEVSASGYYDWRGAAKRARERRERELVDEIRDIQAQSRGTYGSPRVHRELKASGRSCTRRRVAELMRKHGLRARTKRRFKATTNSRHGLPVAGNLLLDRAPPTRIDQVWVGDITYLPTREGWLYLAAVVDLFSRNVVGWSMSERMTSDLVQDALGMALDRRRPAPGLIHHSDRGSRYASLAFQQLLFRHGLVCSMSRKGNCWDNAVMESFFHTLKTELTYLEDYVTRAQARSSTFEFIEAFYNRQRRHSALGYVSPVEFEGAVLAAREYEQSS